MASSEAPGTEKSEWLTYLDDEIASDEPWVARDLAREIRTLLLPGGDISVRETALRIDALYEKHLTIDPQLKLDDDNGMESFLLSLYVLIFELALFLPYNDDTQDTLVQLLLELHKLPPKTYKIRGVDVTVYTKDPIFGATIDDEWNSNYPGDGNEKESGPTVEDLERYDEWVNFSSFLARCLDSGLLDRYPNRTKYPSFDIPKGLETDLLPGPKRDCKILVSAQYITLAGTAIYADDVVALEGGSEAKKRGWEMWKLWAEKLRQVSTNDEERPEVKEAASKALTKMISLSPDLVNIPADE